MQVTDREITLEWTTKWGEERKSRLRSDGTYVWLRAVGESRRWIYNDVRDALLKDKHGIALVPIFDAAFAELGVKVDD